MLFFVAFGVLAAGAVLYFAEVRQHVLRRESVAALIWQLKDAGDIAGPVAGKLLSRLYKDGGYE